MAAQKAQADVLFRRLHYALPGWWSAAAERRDAQGEFHSAAHARAWGDGGFDADQHGLDLDGVGRSALGPLNPQTNPGVRPQRGGGGEFARGLAVYGAPAPQRRYHRHRHVHRPRERLLLARLRGRCLRAFADAKMEKGQTEWRIMAQIGCRCPLGKQDAFLERVRGFEAREAPADWRQQLGLWGPVGSLVASASIPVGNRQQPGGRKEEEEEIIRLPWRGQCGRAAAARALCACCAAGYAKDRTGSPVCF
jgi:hypothetical protein